MPHSSSSVSVPVAFLTLSALFLAGCGVSNYSMKGSGVTEPALASVSGTLYGGQQPIYNSTVTLYAPATTGYGAAPTALASTNTNSTGGFSLSSYTCPANSGDVYLLATGGDPGTGANSAIAMAVLLGPCSGLSSLPSVSLNEATTVAAAYTLAQFATLTSTGTNIGTSSTNLVGLNNAYAAATNLVNPSTGVPNSPTALTGMLLPTAEVNTLANILASCVNTNGTTSTCSSLLSDATPPNGTAPIDTFQAAIDIALNPTNKVTPLFNLASSSPPFQTPLATAPSDFALAIQYNGNPLANCGFTSGVAIDQTGNAWVGCGTGTSNGALTEITPSGSFLTGVNGFYTAATTGGSFQGPNGIAIDANGSAWITSAAQNTVYNITPSGASNAFYYPTDLNGPTGIGILNGAGKVYVADTDNVPVSGQPSYTGRTLTILNLDGTESGDSPFRGFGGYGPLDVIPTDGPYIYINYAGSTGGSCCQASVGQLTPTDTATNIYTPAPPYPLNYGLAADASTNIWYSQSGQINEVTGPATAIIPAITPAFTPTSLLFDGNGSLFVAGSPASNTQTAGQLAIYSGTSLLGTVTANNTLPVTAYAPTGIDIDASGNVWVTGTSSTSAGFVTEIIGLAGPLPTPRSVASQLNKVASRP